ncbi:LOW QUALITY PROTEIN: Nitrate reductase, alpha subunit [Phytophthora palmivora]|uniref:Nitrate reductase, alpha subunit n=1 Tax=Phytophthora palmivora TaxID=4796 RepID=A0A2P4XF78_9STRA|nr:LOW QUALITY PROTEIN: Nitrate reductase, alpha subunit [Phytophthora palmivora]
MPSFLVGRGHRDDGPIVYELISASELITWDQGSLVNCVKDAATMELSRNAAALVKSQWTLYCGACKFSDAKTSRLSGPLTRRGTIGDQAILDKIKERVEEVMNGHIHDIFEFLRLT